MCGIIGVTGLSDPLAAVLEGLELLEYRGYDSAGIVGVEASGKALWRVRAAEHGGSIDRLRAEADGGPGPLRACLGHTRWATHGAPSEENAHPHLDCSGRVAVVHNGIIENHRELAAELDRSGHKRASATDTEILAHLVEAEIDAGADLAEAVRRCLLVLRGDFAVALVHVAEPDLIVAARRTSPLVVGTTASAGVVASDVAAALSTTRQLYALEDDQVAEVAPGRLLVRDLEGRRVEPARIDVAWSVERALKGGYPDFMSKEIHEQPRAAADTLLGRVSPGGATEIEELGLDEEELRATRRVLLVGCGSSYHACLVARHAFERWAAVPAEAEIASELRYREPVLAEGTLAIAVSQSGETVDSLHAMREARRRGARVLALTNVVDSVMAREADGVLYTRAGPEVGVASTKSHVAQLVMLEAFALHLARARGTLREGEPGRLAGELLGLAGSIGRVLEREEDYLSLGRRFSASENFYYLGRRLGLPVAMEGALKLKELAYVRAEAYPAGEMKHGPISLIEPGAVVVVVATRTPLWEKVMANVEEMRARGATVLGVADEGDEETARLLDGVLVVPPTSELLSPVVCVVPLQCFAYAVARARGNDVDRPRNLAKVVTVE